MGFFEKIKNGLARTKQSMTVSMNNLFSSFTGENEEFFDDLEETLILADAGVETAENAVQRLREVVQRVADGCFCLQRGHEGDEAREQLVQIAV